MAKPLESRHIGSLCSPVKIKYQMQRAEMNPTGQLTRSSGQGVARHSWTVVETDVHRWHVLMRQVCRSYLQGDESGNQLATPMCQSSHSSH